MRYLWLQRFRTLSIPNQPTAYIRFLFIELTELVHCHDGKGFFRGPIVNVFLETRFFITHHQIIDYGNEIWRSGLEGASRIFNVITFN